MTEKSSKVKSKDQTTRNLLANT